ncbi:MAG: 1-deoxy-D-xylulose-5-phosphate reductoisomerase [Rhodospirillales bacterium]|nr:1-deoxy-D-xylulose-5-phosphate reductoisomerase [Rhodospirillales bacterium]
MVQLETRPSDQPRSVTILGATGSVGCNTVDLLERHPGRFRVEAITGHRNVSRLAEQAKALKAGLAVIADDSRYADLKDALSGTGIEAAAGANALVEAAERPAEWVMSSIVGAAGLRPTLSAVRRGAIVALANKECLVSAGDVMMAEIKKSGAVLLPVDSEHNAIFQVLDFEQSERIERIILTASGGPFLELDARAMEKVSREQAVAHPNWDMGAKISVDSATMMNKGLELIEAFHLFPVVEDRIEILVHPQSVIHSMVEYIDGSVLAQLGSPDMRIPISFTLGWPRRINTPSRRLSLADIGTLTFRRPDPRRFPSLRLAREALRTGGAATTILNAANEEAVQSFLQEEIGFLDIARIVEETLGTTPNGPLNTLDDVDEADRQARAISRDLIRRLSARQ